MVVRRLADERDGVGDQHRASPAIGLVGSPKRPLLEAPARNSAQPAADLKLRKRKVFSHRGFPCCLLPVACCPPLPIAHSPLPTCNTPTAQNSLRLPPRSPPAESGPPAAGRRGTGWPDTPRSSPPWYC